MGQCIASLKSVTAQRDSAVLTLKALRWSVSAQRRYLSSHDTKPMPTENERGTFSSGVVVLKHRIVHFVAVDHLASDSVANALLTRIESGSAVGQFLRY